MLHKVLNPGATIGILGGGQLGMLTARRAMELGYRVIIYTPPGDTPATELPGVRAVVAEYGDEKALVEFANDCDVVTSEFENVPLFALETIGANAPVRPGPTAMRVARDRKFEKEKARELCLPTVEYFPTDGPADMAKAKTLPLFPGILKTRCLGYDGHGQRRVNTPDELESVWRELGSGQTILEALANLRCELSVIVARNALGQVAYLGPFENQHKDGILRETIYPTKQVDQIIKSKAIEMAIRLTTNLGVEGLLAVEMFVTTKGEILINEIAPRPHNSGHLSIEAFDLSQYDLLIKAICNQQLTDPPKLLCRRAQMINILGQDIDRSDLIGTGEEAAGAKNRYVCIYGKKTAKVGRKMGHVTLIY